MKVAEILKLSAPLLKWMSKNEVMLDDWQYVDLYEQYIVMRSYNIKYREIIRHLSEEYNISKSTVERVVRRLSKDC